MSEEWTQDDENDRNRAAGQGGWGDEKGEDDSPAIVVEWADALGEETETTVAAFIADFPAFGPDQARIEEALARGDRFYGACEIGMPGGTSRGPTGVKIEANGGRMPRLTQRERAAVLTGLQFLAMVMPAHDHWQKIMTDCGKVEAMTVNEINDLGRRMQR